MNGLTNAWRQDEGSIDFIQIFVGLLIIAIAAVGTFQALFYGYEQLDFQMRYRNAICIARSYVEYWQGRIHTDIDFRDRATMLGNLRTPREVILDSRDPSTVLDDVYCNVAYGAIREVDFEATGAGVDHYLIYVIVTWWEPNDSPVAPPHEVAFHAAMVPAAL